MHANEPAVNVGFARRERRVRNAVKAVAVPYPYDTPYSYR